MKAETKKMYKEWLIKHHNLPKDYFKSKHFGEPDEITVLFAEAYHKARVEAISDEAPKDYVYHDAGYTKKALVEIGIKHTKQKLLNN